MALDYIFVFLRENAQRRTTLDLLEPLVRDARARAAMEGLKLKEYFARLVEVALQRPSLANSEPKRSPALVFRRRGAKPMPALSNAQLNALMDKQDTTKISKITRG